MRDLDRGRDAGRRFAWAEAFEALSLADRSAPLDADDLVLLATAAYLLNRMPETVAALRRACEEYLSAGRPASAARAAYWIVFALSNQRDFAQAAGWLARAEYLLESQPPDVAEHGLLLGARAFRHNMSGEYVQAHDAAAKATEIGRRSGDPDVRGLGLTQFGAALMRLGRTGDALAALDEAMVAVVSAEISPIAAGTVYCTVISVCNELVELRRAAEWTQALDAWCAKQPDMVSFTGLCLVHRAELLQLRGEWPEAVAEVERACERLAGSPEEPATGAAKYRLAEIHRASGNYAAAEEAYREASEWGHDPCPGFALLRLAQGDGGAAQAVIRRALSETTEPLHRVRLLPAYAEIMLDTGEPQAASEAADELDGIAERYGTPALQAAARYVKGAVLLSKSDPAAALVALRVAVGLWRELDVPYEVARTRVLIALACRELGDRDSARLDLDAAARVFARLGAAPDLARIASLTSQDAPHGLTDRELQVLRLVATGRTNHAIGVELSLSEKTIERHVSHLFGKLGVASRAAATAYAYQHNLV